MGRWVLLSLCSACPRGSRPQGAPASVPAFAHTHRNFGEGYQSIHNKSQSSGDVGHTGRWRQVRLNLADALCLCAGRLAGLHVLGAACSSKGIASHRGWDPRPTIKLAKRGLRENFLTTALWQASSLHSPYFWHLGLNLEALYH